MSQVVLITGATDGIGRALAEQVHARGDRGVFVGRRPREEIDSDLFTDASYCRADLLTPGAPTKIAAFLEAHGIDRLDALIHNAGRGTYGPVAEESTASVRATLDLNLVAPIALTHALLPRVEAARGRVVFVSSVVVDLPVAELATYAASKAALDGFARSLRIELQDRVSVVRVHPGATATRMHEKAGLPPERVAEMKMPSAAAVAARILDASDRRRGDTTIGGGNRVARFVGRRLGRPLDALMRRRNR